MLLLNASAWDSNHNQTFFTTNPDSPLDAISCKNFYEPFAWVKYDDQQITAARDHFGLEPFYYFFNDKEFIFGSNIPDIIKYLASPPALNGDRCIAECFSYRNAEPPSYSTETLHKNIYRVTPGHILTIKNGKASEKAFWELNPDAPSIFYRDSRDYYANFTYLLEKAVSLNSQDTNLGLELSGGLDSSLLFIECQKLNKKPLCFTHAQEENSEENTLVKSLVSKFNWSHKHFVIDADSFYPLEVFDWCAELFAGSPPYLFFMLANNIHKAVATNKCTTLISGFGGDECISSYALPSIYFPQAMRDRPILSNWRELKLHQKNFNGKISSSLSRARQLFNYRYKSAGSIAKTSIRYNEYHALQGINSHSIRMRVEYSAIVAKALGFQYRYPYLYPPLVEYCLQLPITQKRTNGLSRLLSRQYLQEHTQINLSKTIKLSGSICHASLQKCLTQYEQGEFSKAFQNPPFQEAWFYDERIHGVFIQRLFSYMFGKYLKNNPNLVF